MADGSVRWVLVMLVVGLVRSSPVGYGEAERPLGAAPGLGRLAARAEPRLPLPSPQELEAIRKVAQLLVTLGEQHDQRNGELEMLNDIIDSLRTIYPKSKKRKQKNVIPALVGGGGAPHHFPPPSPPPQPTVEEIPNDPVKA